jgi:hypothetical protein
MGADIHALIEYSKDGTKWESGGEPEIGRDYALFGVLAGVRGGQDPIDEPRGKPDDASDAFNQWYSEWANDAHSTGWLGLKELSIYVNSGMWKCDVICETCNQSTGKEEDESLEDSLKRLEEAMLKVAQDQNTNSVRLVFFFDS